MGQHIRREERPDPYQLFVVAAKVTEGLLGDPDRIGNPRVAELGRLHSAYTVALLTRSRGNFADGQPALDRARSHRAVRRSLQHRCSAQVQQTAS